MKKILFLLLSLLLIFVTYIRYNQLSSHFSHVDDLIVPNLITSLDLDEEIDEYFAKSHNSNYIKNVIHSISNTIRPVTLAFAVAKFTTYAPIQFLITSIILDEDSNYKEVLFWSRFPSFLFSIISLVLLILILKIVFNDKYLVMSLFGVSIMGLSWEFIIYSVQSSSYSIGILIVLLSILIFCKISYLGDITKKQSLLIGLVLSILIFSNYQFIFFIPGFFISLLLGFRKDIKKMIKEYSIILVVLFCSFLILYYVFLKDLYGSGLNWNRGLNNEFLFTFNETKSFWENVSYFFNFFFKNTYITIRSILSIGKENRILNDIISIVVIVTSITGLIHFILSKEFLKRHLAYYGLISTIVWMVLVMMQMITLSPTRHSLILLPFITIFFSAGLDFILVKVNTNNNPVCILVFITYLSFFLLDFNQIRDDRMDPFDENEIENIIKDYNVSYIYAYSYTWNLLFMEHVRCNFVNENSFDIDLLFTKKGIKENNIVMFITHKNIIISEDIIEDYLNIEKSTYHSYNIIYRKEIINDTEVCFSSLTKNGTNSMMMYIVRFN